MTTLPPISASLQAAIRAYGLENGWKNAAKALAWGPTCEELAPSAAPPKARRNGRKNGHRKMWWRYVTPEELLERQELDRTRFQRDIPWPFTWARPTTLRALDATDIRLSHYYPADCCNTPMGIMEAWDGGSVKAVYQCAVSRKHTRTARRRDICDTCGGMMTDNDGDAPYQAYARRTCGVCKYRERLERAADYGPALVPGEGVGIWIRAAERALKSKE